MSDSGGRSLPDSAGRGEHGPPTSPPRGRRTPGGLDLYGKGDVWIVAEPGGPVLSAFYALAESPGWWRGHCHGRVRQVYARDAEPAEVAARFFS